jgi:hypothetical protein
VPTLTFDPHAHPRDRVGKFREIIGALKAGQSVKVRGGGSVHRGGDGSLTVKGIKAHGTNEHAFDGPHSASDFALRSFNRDHLADDEKHDETHPEMSKAHANIDRYGKLSAFGGAVKPNIAKLSDADLVALKKHLPKSDTEGHAEIALERHKRARSKVTGDAKPGSKMSRRSGHGLLAEALTETRAKLTEAVQERKLAKGGSEHARARAHEVDLRETIELLELLERAVGTSFHFDPRLHPRNRRGEFANVLGLIHKQGHSSAAHMPGDVAVVRHGGRWHVMDGAKRVTATRSTDKAVSAALASFDSKHTSGGWNPMQSGVTTARTHVANPARVHAMAQNKPSGGRVSMEQLKATFAPGAEFNVTNHYITKEDHPYFGTRRAKVLRVTSGGVWMDAPGGGETKVEWPKMSQVYKEDDGSIRFHGGGSNQKADDLFLTFKPVKGR